MRQLIFIAKVKYLQELLNYRVTYHRKKSQHWKKNGVIGKETNFNYFLLNLMYSD